MPRYARPPCEIPKERVQEMIDRCERERDKAIIAILWIYGLRPAELVMLKRENFEIRDDVVILKHETVKHKNIKGIVGEQRKIVTKIVPRNTPFMDIVVNYVNKFAPGDYLFSLHNWKLSPMSTQWVKMIVYEASRCMKCAACRIRKRCPSSIPPYFFRHNRNNNFAKLGKGVKFLVDWNGWDDIRTALKYVRREPVEVKEGEIF